ncbi:MAG TPA: hypothetical protein VMZ11_04790 [Mycobacteriales bacterium]|nr:hypothetical protein [Mycobacteriales bacterium]
MLTFLEWLRRLDALVLSRPDASHARLEPRGHWGAVLAVVGSLVVVGAALLLAAHVPVQLAVISAGLLLTVPYLQDGFDRAVARLE